MTTSSVNPPQPKSLPGVAILGLTVHNVTMQTALAAMDGFFAAGSPAPCGHGGRLHARDGAGRCGPPRHRQRRGPGDARQRRRLVGLQTGGRARCRSASPGSRSSSSCAAARRRPAIASSSSARGRAWRRRRRRRCGRNIRARRSSARGTAIFKPDETDALVAEIREAQADAVFVAMGIPKQEKWIAAHRDRLGRGRADRGGRHVRCAVGQCAARAEGDAAARAWSGCGGCCRIRARSAKSCCCRVSCAWCVRPASREPDERGCRTAAAVTGRRHRTAGEPHPLRRGPERRQADPDRRAGRRGCPSGARPGARTGPLRRLYRPRRPAASDVQPDALLLAVPKRKRACAASAPSFRGRPARPLRRPVRPDPRRVRYRPSSRRNRRGAL